MKKCLMFLLALLLTGSLVLFAATFAVRSAVLPAMADEGASVSVSTSAGEMEVIRQKISEIAEIYGFNPDTAAAVVTDETLRELDAQAALWWSSVLRYGSPGKEPVLATKPLEKAILADEQFLKSHDEEEADYYAGEAAAAVAKAVQRAVLPMRIPIVGKGLAEVSARADLPNLISFMLALPWTALALSALLAGLIALLDFKKLRFGLQYIGSALGGAALVVAALILLLGMSGIRKLIWDSSMSLSVQYSAIESGMTGLLWGLAAAMLAGCVVLLLLSGRKKKA